MAFVVLSHYWWVVFPLMFMVSGIIRIVLRNDYRRHKLELIKSYLQNGKDIPDALKRELEL